MKLLCTRLGHDGDLRARAAPELWRVGRRLNAKLLPAIHGDKGVRAAANGQRRQSSAKALAQQHGYGAAEVHTHAIHHEVVGVGALPVDA